ncbi:MAG: mechanosensitive ion channel [Bacteroidaceae bacterium]|nr:mechanosensitive ion channel [Bacteroidaceae bacterium]
MESTAAIWLDRIIDLGIAAGKNILVATLIFCVGRYAVKLLNTVFARMLGRTKIDTEVQTFLRSLVNILLTVLLIVSVIGALGIETTSFAALLASAGVAVGMALSGQLQNLAGGIIILLLKPYKAGDLVEVQGQTGHVREIQIFHTILVAFDNRVVYIPNATMSSNVIVNRTQQQTRRLEWTIGISYGENIERVRTVLLSLLATEPRILPTPAPAVVVDKMGESSVDIIVRAWVNTDDYWDVNYQMNQAIYDRFNKEGIEFPFPQTTVHMAAN